MHIHRNEITTGILTLVTFGILIGVLVVIGMPGLLKPLNTYRIYFDNASGVRTGAPVLLAGREIGKVTALHSPIPLEKRPKGHANYEIAIDVKVDRSAGVHQDAHALLKQQSLMGQKVIDFVDGNEKTPLAANHTEFVGERIPDLSEMVEDTLQRFMGPRSDLSGTLRNLRELTDTLKHEPWRLVWPSTKQYPEDKKVPPKP